VKNIRTKEVREAVLSRGMFGKDGFHLAKTDMGCNGGNINLLHL
jgi:hypothetical protein